MLEAGIEAIAWARISSLRHVMQGQIQQFIGGPGRRPSLTKSTGWSWLQEAVCLGRGGDLSLKSLMARG